MDLNWEAIGAIGEILGALAVVISILYLAIQINTNTRTMKANAGFEAAHSWAAANEGLADVSDEILTLLMRSLEPSESWENFSAIERMRISVRFRATFQRLEGQYYLYKYGNLDKGIWESRSTWAAGLLQLPFYQSWWKIEKDQRIYSDEYIQALESTDPIPVSTTVLGGDLRDA